MGGTDTHFGARHAGPAAKYTVCLQFPRTSVAGVVLRRCPYNVRCYIQVVQKLRRNCGGKNNNPKATAKSQISHPAALSSGRPIITKCTAIANGFRCFVLAFSLNSTPLASFRYVIICAPFCLFHILRLPRGSSTSCTAVRMPPIVPPSS